MEVIDQANGPIARQLRAMRVGEIRAITPPAFRTVKLTLAKGVGGRYLLYGPRDDGSGAVRMVDFETARQHAKIQEEARAEIRRLADREREDRTKARAAAETHRKRSASAKAAHARRKAAREDKAALDAAAARRTGIAPYTPRRGRR